MTDPDEQNEWYKAYLCEAKKVAPPPVGSYKLEQWARSMALIAEQLFDPEDDEMVEG